MFLLSIVAFMFLGIFVGFIGGFFGIGGGIIVVPSLLVFFYLFNIPLDQLMHVATGTSLAAMIFTSCSSAWAHFKHNGMQWSLIFYLAPGLILGSLLGAYMAHLFPGNNLYILFALFLCGVGVYHLLQNKPEESKNAFNPSLWVITLIGLATGGLSSFFGIGGGIITVPALTATGLPIRNAVATSAFCGFIVALLGAVTFAFLGYHAETNRETIGYLYMPAFLSIGICSSIAAPYGAKYAYIVHPETLNKIFGIFILTIGLAMICIKIL